MPSKAKEKKSKKNTKDSQYNFENEIVIGVTPIGEKKEQKKKKKKIVKQKEKKNQPKVVKNKEEEIAIELPIEKKQNQKAKSKKKVKNKQPKKLTKKQEIAKKKRKVIFRILKWLLLLAICIGGMIYFLLSPFFNIKTITISGNSKITKEEILSLSKIEIDENTFKIQTDKVSNAIKQNAYIDTIKVNRKLPDGIAIEVTERKATFMLVFANAYVYMNNQGYLLEVSDKPIDNVPMLIGYTTPEDQIQVGNRLQKEDLQKLGDILQIMESANSNGIGNLVTKINIADKQDYIFELNSEKKTIHMGDTSNLSTKMLYIKKMIEEEKNTEAEFFVNIDFTTKFPIFRKKV